MRNSLARPSARRGFTLVELMIVIAIIGLLVAILAAALSPFLSKGGEMTTRNDINQFGIALENFKSQFGFYPPSQFILCEKLEDYQNLPAAISPIGKDSLYYIGKMFARIPTAVNTSGGTFWNVPNPPASPVWFGVDWNLNGVYDTPKLLTGDQCLVFFLGGIQTSINNALTCNGWGTSASSPFPTGMTAATPIPSSATTYGPYFEFKANRLVAMSINGYFAYKDGYNQNAPNGTPAVYAYFSSGRTRNNYNRYGTSDCSTLTALNPATSGVIAGVYPYLTGFGSNYHNPNTYQIISPGKDGVFGIGSPVYAPGTAPPALPLANPQGYTWTTVTSGNATNLQVSSLLITGNVAKVVNLTAVPGVPTTAGSGDGRDDITNFNSTLLGKQ